MVFDHIYEECDVCPTIAWHPEGCRCGGCCCEWCLHCDKSQDDHEQTYGYGEPPRLKERV